MSAIPVRPASSTGANGSRPLSAWSSESAGARESKLNKLRSRFSLKARTSTSRRGSGEAQLSNSPIGEELHIKSPSPSTSFLGDGDNSLLGSTAPRPLSASNTADNSPRYSPSLNSIASAPHQGSLRHSSGHLGRSTSHQAGFARPKFTPAPRSTSFSSLQELSTNPSHPTLTYSNSFSGAPPSPNALTHGNSPPASLHRLPITSQAYGSAHRLRQLSDISTVSSSTSIKQAASAESPTLVYGSHMAEAQSAQQHIPEIVREEAEEDEQTGSLYSEGTRDSSKSVQLQQLEHHRHSPLDELIEDLGGRRKSSVATDDTSSHAEPTPHASPLMHGWPSSISDQYRAPPLASLSEEDTDENDLETSSDVTAEAAVEAAHQKLRDSLMLPSAWSNTNSVRSSGETHLSSNAHNEELEHAAATASPSLPFEESPNDPLNQSQFPPNFLADALNVSTSTNASEIRRRSTQAVPTSLPLKDFPASSDSTQTSHTSQRTPKTSRRWSIVEMEQAYSRMRQLFASNASFNRSVLESSLGASSEDQFNTTETPKPDQRDFLNDAPQKPKQNDVGPPAGPSFNVITSSSSNQQQPARTAFDNHPQEEPDLPGSFPADTSFSSEMKDGIAPLNGDPSYSGSTHHARGSSSPLTFVTSLSDDFPRAPVHAQDFSSNRRSGPVQPILTRSWSASTLNTPSRHRRNGSIVSSTTATNDAGWATPRSSLSPARDDASVTSSADHVRAWARSIEPVFGPNYLLQDQPYRASPSDGTAASRSRGTTPTEDAIWSDTPAYRSKSRRRPLESSLSRRDDTASSVMSQSFSDFRSMDKVELFLKFSQTQAEYEALKKKTAMEREALFDALSETRSSLYDTRRQRDELQQRLQNTESSVEHKERVNALLRSKTLWQERAQSAAAELDEVHKLLSRSKSKEDEMTHENILLSSKVATLSAELKDTESKLSSALELQQKVLDQLPENRPYDDDTQPTAKLPMQSTPPRESAQPAGHQTTPSTVSPRKPSGLPLSNSYTRLPSRVASPRQRHQSNAGSLADFDKLQNAAQSTPLQATKIQFGSPDASLAGSTSMLGASRIGKPKSGLPRFRTTSNNSTKSTISSSALDQSVRSSSPASSSAFIDHTPGRAKGLFDLREDEPGLNSEDMAFLKDLDA